MLSRVEHEKAFIISEQGVTSLSELQSPVSDFVLSFEPRHEKTGFLHMRKQRRRSASR